MQIPPFMNREEATSELEAVTVQLRSWERHKFTDSKTIDRLRQRDLGLSMLSLTKLHNHLDPSLKVHIVTGSDEIQGSRFSKDSYDFYTEYLKTLPPATVIPCDRIELMELAGQRDSVFYIGSRAVMLALPKLAETITAGGSLTLAEANDPTSVLSSSE